MTFAICLEPDLRLIRANNPSALTGAGTNTYLVGSNAICVIDPGPEDEAHLAGILDAVGQPHRVQAILVTHAHLDHSPLAGRLAQMTGAPVLAFGDAGAGRAPLMQDLATRGLVGGGEGVDQGFRPDRSLRDGEILRIGDEQIKAIWTPGHFGNHMSFAWRGAVFSGDHVMGWSSTLVSPPDGDLAAYMRSLDRLGAERARTLFCGHGDPVPDPARRIEELRAHRLQREAQILEVLGRTPATVADLVTEIYVDVAPSLHRAAGRNVFAHLIDLHERNLVTAAPDLRVNAVYRLTSRR